MSSRKSHRALQKAISSTLARASIKATPKAPIADLNRLVQIAPQSPLGYAKLGQLRAAQKRWKEAENYYKEALKRTPDFPDAIQGLAELDMDQGKPDEALLFLQAQLAPNPNNAALYLLKAKHSYRRKSSPTQKRHSRAAPNWTNKISQPLPS